MTTQIIVVENPSDWKSDLPNPSVISVNDYVAGQEYFKQRNIQVINLCRSFRYLSVGYYCSLLAEARRHRVIPSVKTMLDLSSKAMYNLYAEDLDALVEKTLRKGKHSIAESVFIMDVFFGHCRYEGLNELARQIFETFPAPLLRVEFQRHGKWRVASVKPLPANKLDEAQRPLFTEAFERYQKKRWPAPRSRTMSRYDLAILHNPQDPLAPSDKRALQNFIKAGKELGVDVDLVERKDYAKLAEYDALFIRDTTRINHYTYRFAKKAESEGMVVIDDPTSILKCCNKVYLAELLRANRIPTPRTRILRKSDLIQVERDIDYPIVLKVPDGSFSRGVHKAESREQLLEVAGGLFKESGLILAQEYLYTEFDWRIGVLNRRPIFACQYFMSKKHWQIVNYDHAGRATEGGYKAWRLEDVPARVIAVALSAANLIGNGLYGVDIKQKGEEAYVIEINDNPNLEAGVEDSILKDELYRGIMAEFVRRMEQRRLSEV